MKSEKTATLRIGTLEKVLPIRKDNLGQAHIVIDDLYSSTGCFVHDPGYKNTGAYQSSICYINGDEGILAYRGYDISVLADQYDYVSICHLLLYGDLPDDSQHFSFSSILQKHQKRAYKLSKHLSQISADAKPMNMLLALVNLYALEHQEDLPVASSEVMQSLMLEIIGIMPVFVAMCQRHHNKLPSIPPREDLSYVANFLYMLNGELPSKRATTLLEAVLILHAEHEQNASTSTVRSVASTQSHPFAAISSGIAALMGPSHGGANEACIRMLTDIADVDHINLYIDKAKDKNDPFRLMGFGHRVYKNNDPRAVIMHKLCAGILSGQDSSSLFSVAEALEKIALQDPYFIERKLYPNVDFYSGLTLKYLGISVECFTTVFALARTSGWASHLLEMHSQNTPIVRPRQIYTGKFIKSS